MTTVLVIAIAVFHVLLHNMPILGIDSSNITYFRYLFLRRRIAIKDIEYFEQVGDRQIRCHRKDQKTEIVDLSRLGILELEEFLVTLETMVPNRT